MVYAVEADVEGYMVELFGATSQPTTTELAALLESLSDLVDAIDNVAEDFYSASIPMRVKMAVVSTASAIIQNQRDPDTKPLTDIEIRNTMKAYLADSKVQEFQVTRDDVDTS